LYKKGPTGVLKALDPETSQQEKIQKAHSEKRVQKKERTLNMVEKRVHRRLKKEISTGGEGHEKFDGGRRSK